MLPWSFYFCFFFKKKQALFEEWQTRHGHMGSNADPWEQADPGGAIPLGNSETSYLFV